MRSTLASLVLLFLSASLCETVCGATPGLIAHYKLDETTTSLLIDETGNFNGEFVDFDPGLDVTLNVTGQDGGAVLFPGLGSVFALAGDRAGLNPDTFTIAFWAKGDPSGSHEAPVSSRENNEGFTFYYVNGNAQFWIQTTSDWQQFSVSTDTDWRHYAASYDGQLVRFYKDGVLEASGAYNGTLDNWRGIKTDSLIIGTNGGGFAFNGAVDDVQYYGQSLSDTDIAFLFNNPGQTIANTTPLISDVETELQRFFPGESPTFANVLNVADGEDLTTEIVVSVLSGDESPELDVALSTTGAGDVSLVVTSSNTLMGGYYPLMIEARDTGGLVTTATVTLYAQHVLVAHYKLDDAPGSTTMTDSSGNGFDGTYFNNPALGQTITPKGMAGTAMETLISSNSYALSPVIEEFHEEVYTFSFWVRHSSKNTSYETPIATRAGEDGWNIYLEGPGAPGPGRLSYWQRQSGAGWNPVSAFDLGSDWRHVAGTYNGSVKSLYVDGRYVGQNPSTSRRPSNGLGIAARPNGGNQFTGWLDDVQFYDVELNGDQIAHLYRNPGATLDNGGAIGHDGGTVGPVSPAAIGFTTVTLRNLTIDGTPVTISSVDEGAAGDFAIAYLLNGQTITAGDFPVVLGPNATMQIVATITGTGFDEIHRGLLTVNSDAASSTAYNVALRADSVSFDASSLALRVTAADIDGDGWGNLGEPQAGDVFRWWEDAHGRDIRATGPIDEGMPNYVNSDPNLGGLPTVNFDGNNDYIVWPEYNIRTGFLVVRENPSPTNDESRFFFLFGHSTQSNFHRGYPTDGIHRSLYHPGRPTAVAQGAVNQDGVRVNPWTTLFPNNYASLTAIVADDGVPTNQNRDRAFPGRVLDGELAEMLIFAEELSRADVLAVEKMLSAKWGTPAPENWIFLRESLQLTSYFNRTDFNEGDRFEIDFQNVGVPSAKDNLSFFAAGDDPTVDAPVAKIYADGTATGVTPTAFGPLELSALDLGLSPGDYEAYLMSNDAATTLTDSVAFTILPTPSHLPIIDGLLLHYSASDVDGDGSPLTGEPLDNDVVTTVADLSGRANTGTAAVGEEPTYIASASTMNSSPTLRFENVDKFIFANRLTNIRTAIWLLNEPTGVDQSGTNSNFLLGDPNNYHFHRGSAPPFTIYYNNSGAIAKDGDTRLNGVLVNPLATPIPADVPSLISTAHNVNMNANSISNDRGIANREFQGDLAELILFGRELSAREVMDVEKHLAAKYNITLPGAITLSDSKYNPTETILIDFVNPSIPEIATDNISIFTTGAAPVAGSELVKLYLDGSDTGTTPTGFGVLELPIDGNLTVGEYQVYLMAADSDTVLVGPVGFEVVQPLSDSPVLNGLKFHVRASDMNGDGSSLTGEPSGATTVTLWGDLSGRDHDTWELDPAKLPEYRPGVAGLNGEPALYFDGDNDSLGTTDTFTAKTIIAVAAYDGDPFGSFPAIFASPAPYNVSLYGSNLNLGSQLGGLSTFWVNGAQTSSFPPLNEHKIIVLEGQNAHTGRWKIGEADGDWLGEIAEILVYDRALTADEQEAIGSWLSLRYRIASEYPAPPSVTATTGLEILQGGVLNGVTLGFVEDFNDPVSTLDVLILNAEPLVIDLLSINPGGLTTGTVVGRIDSTSSGIVPGSTIDAIIQVSDGTDIATDTLSIEINIIPNTPPKIIVTRTFVILEPGATDPLIDFVGVVTDDEQAIGNLGVTISDGLFPGLTMSVSNFNGVVQISGQASLSVPEGIYFVTIEVSDGLATDTDQLKILVPGGPLAADKAWMLLE